MADVIKENIFTKISRTVATGIAFSFAIAINPLKAEAASFTPQLIQEDLFFGRNIPEGGEVSQSQFQTFVNNVITPRFPDGLTVFDAAGQFRDSTGTIIREKSKNVALFAENSPQNQIAINDIAGTYIKNFNQESILRVTNKDDLKVSFGLDSELFDNSPIPKFIRADLFFGRNIPGGGEVSQSQFQTFVNNVITPRFPDGLTIFDASGQFRESTGTIIREQSKTVSLLLENTLENEAAINEIVKEYTQQFNQESVLQAINEDVNVSFDRESDLFENPPTSKFIRADLFFGRNIPGGGEVSQSQFQTFVNNVITPRFPDGLTIFDASGQFRDSSGTLIQEQSKIVTLLLENTLENEASINEIVKAYTQQFNQESVLQVVDEDIEVAFLTSSKSTSIPEPASATALFIFIVGAGLRCKNQVKGRS